MIFLFLRSHFYLMIKTITFLLTIAWISAGIGQEDAVLMYVQEEPVTVSEFTYIYEKNNRDKADYSRASLEEYLELYTNFKLKVRQAKDEKYHERPGYIEELSGYRRQLSEGYVFEKEVEDFLVEQLMDRKKYDIGVSHIMVSLSRNASAEEVEKARQKVEMIRQLLDEGRDFGLLAQEVSEDPGSKGLKGDIGYITSPLPEGYLEFEHAAYETEKGKYSGVVRTDMGFHILMVTDSRPARGHMRARHILIRKEKNGIPLANAALKINELYRHVTAEGLKFEDVARSQSEDLKTASSGGDLGYFGIGQYERPFEDAAFGLKKDGDISKPVETSIGWHIIQRVSKRPVDSEERIRNMLKQQVGRSSRIQDRTDEVVEKISKDAGFVSHDKAFTIFVESLDESFLRYDWDPSSAPGSELIAYGDDRYSVADFADYCRSRARDRLQAGSKSPMEVAGELYNRFVEEKAFEYVQNRLENYYPAFKNLMREYEEGILLFEITKDKVWDKASSDTTGLRYFFEKNRERYQWGERLELSTITIDTADKKLVADWYMDLQTSDIDELISRYAQRGLKVTVNSEKVETKSEAARGVPILSGHFTRPVIEPSVDRSLVKKVEKVIPPGLKSLREARGYIVSDYQDELEKRWIQTLRQSYDVSIDTEVLQDLIQTGSNP